MGEITNKIFGQPHGNELELTEYLHPHRTTAQLADIANSINTVDKVLGKHVYEETLGFGYIADGPLPADTWTLNDGLGATQVTPS